MPQTLWRVRPCEDQSGFLEVLRDGVVVLVTDDAVLAGEYVREHQLPQGVVRPGGEEVT